MEKQCEAIKLGLAHRLYLPESYIPENYPQGEGLTLCTIEKNGCPYKKQGEPCWDADMGTAYTCKANAKVPSNIEPINNKLEQIGKSKRLENL